MTLFRNLAKSTSAVSKRHVERKILDTHPIHLFRIIQDVDSYSSFLPLCMHSRVVSKEPDGRSFRGTLTIGMMMPPLQETYLSHVTVSPETWTIETRSLESQNFDALYSRWQLEPLDDFIVHDDDSDGQRTAATTATTKCRVAFEIEITVSNPLIRQTLDTFIAQVGSSQVEAFERRCQEIPLPPDLQFEAR